MSAASLDRDIDANICCMCFVRYEEYVDETGAVWVSCTCGRWLHEDCAEDCVLDGEGKVRTCPFCLDSHS